MITKGAEIMLYLARLAKLSNKIVISFTAGILFCMSAVAEDNSLEIYPLPAVFSPATNAPLFNDIVKNNRDFFVNNFVETMKQNFKNTVDGFSDRTKYKTFVSYLSIPRVAENKYNRGKLLDILLPMTASVQFVNAATGEMLYAYPSTIIGKYRTTAQDEASEDKNSAVEKLYLENYQNIVKEIIAQASKEFNPFSIETVVSDIYRGLFVLDKGTSAGIAKGDLLTDANGNQINVVYSDLEYSIAEKVIGNIQNETAFSKFATGSLTQLKKPKILFINDVKDEKSYGVFASAIGNSADFSLITVDKTFYDMQAALVSLNDSFKSENMNNRTLPDYFLKLDIGKPLFTRYPTNTDYVFLDKYDITVCGNIFDKVGRIVFAKCVNETISDKTVSDIKFTEEARFDVLTKNALVKLADAFANELKFKQRTLKINKTDNTLIYVKDTNGLLSVGNAITVFRKIKTEQKGKEIIIPAWEYKVQDISDGIAICKQNQPIVDGIEKVSKKDIVIAGSLGRNNVQTNIFRYSPDKLTLKNNEIELDDFKELGFIALASSLNLPISTDKEEFDEIINELNSGYGFKQKLSAVSGNDNFTIRAAYKITLKNEKTTKNLLAQEYNIIVGIMSKNGENILKQKGLSQDVHIQVPTKDNKKIIAYELSKFVYTLTQQVANDF
jgi:hypothetical protein